MLKKIVTIVLIPTMFICAEEIGDDFNVEEAKVIEVKEKNKDMKESLDFIDKKSNKTLTKEEIIDKDIETTNPEKTFEVSDTSELGETLDISSENKAVVENENIVPTEPSFVPKSYSKVKYSDKYKWFSLINNKKREVFNQAFSSLRIKGNMESVKNDISTPRNIVINALYYDLIEGRPDLAENFYLIMYKHKNEPENFTFVWSNLIMTDYLLRTGRVKPAKKLIKPMNCTIYKKVKYKCFYYYGAIDYLLTGNNKNVGLQRSQAKIKKASQIYYKKTNKKKKRAW